MLANTLTLTIDGVAKVLTRVNQDNFSSQYQLKAANESIILKIRNQTEKSSGFSYDRHNIEVSHLVYATVTDLEKHYTAACTFRCRTVGGNPAYVVMLQNALNTLVSANATAIANGDS